MAASPPRPSPSRSSPATTITLPPPPPKPQTIQFKKQSTALGDDGDGYSDDDDEYAVFTSPSPPLTKSSKRSSFIPESIFHVSSPIKQQQQFNASQSYSSGLSQGNGHSRARSRSHSFSPSPPSTSASNGKNDTFEVNDDDDDDDGRVDLSALYAQTHQVDTSGSSAFESPAKNNRDKTDPNYDNGINSPEYHTSPISSPLGSPTSSQLFQTKGSSVLEFYCKSKGSGPFYISYGVKAELDLDEMCLRLVKFKGDLLNHSLNSSSHNLNDDSNGGAAGNKGKKSKVQAVRVSSISQTALNKRNNCELLIAYDNSDYVNRTNNLNASLQSANLNSSQTTTNSNITTKRLHFQSAELCLNFKVHLEVMRESGSKLRDIFNELDKRRCGSLTKYSVYKGMIAHGMNSVSSLSRVNVLDGGRDRDDGKDDGNGDGGRADDLNATNTSTSSSSSNNEMARCMQEASWMISLADANTSDGIDFIEFFRLFMFTPCTSVHQALTEWRNKLALDQSRRKSTLQALQEDRLLSSSLRNVYGKSAKSAEAKYMVEGEITMTSVENVRYSFGFKARDNLASESHHFVGSLTLTNYRLILKSHITGAMTKGTRHEISTYFDRLEIPANCIARIEKLDSSCVVIICKDLRPVLCSFEPNDLFLTTLVSAIQTVAFPGKPELTFAFNYKFKLPPAAENGWTLYDPVAEFTRIGVMNSPHARFYRIWSDNYTLCDTYPRQYCLPSSMSESDIMQAAKFRSKCRLPAVSWRNRKNGAVLIRCAQPMVGLKNARSAADEKLLNLYRVRGDSHNPLELEEPSKLYILDARKLLAATGNQVQGKGTEIISNYPHCDLVYCNIENIHVMRESINSLGSVTMSGNEGGGEKGYLEVTTNSYWLRHLQGIMKASVVAVERMELNDSSVLVHCSDGWDRTSQITATTMLLLDPYYRTIRGFAILVEKEWLEFGHKFKDRVGQGDDKKKDERSPVFIQWLDVVHQIMIQFPAAFEFNEVFLIFIADHLHSCLFGTFLGQSAKEREVVLDVKNRTVSIWTYILSRVKTYTNAEYVYNKKTIWPSSSIKVLSVWKRYFCRFDIEAHPRNGGGVGNVGWVDSWGGKSEV